MRSSLFRRVTRYPAAQSLDPRENRLTEVTAAVMEHVDGLGPSIVEYALEAGVVDAARRTLGTDEVARRQQLRALSRALTADRVSVNTQVATSPGRLVDLEVLAASSGRLRRARTARVGGGQARRRPAR